MANKKETSDSVSAVERSQKLAELTAKYLQDLPKQLAEIKNALDEENYTSIKTQAHNIKGVSGTYQLDRIYKKSLQLERFVENQNSKEILNTIGQIMNLIEEEIGQLDFDETIPAASGSERMKISACAPFILLVDDDLNLLDIMAEHVKEWGYSYCGVTDSAAMWKELKRITPNVILLDMKLGDEDGIALVSQLKERFPFVPVIIITAYASIETAVESVKSGAYNYICKPFNFERLRIEIDKAIEHNCLSVQVKALQCNKLYADFHSMVGRSEPMHTLYKLIETVAPTDSPVLILGKTGTGKELAARAIHECSDRRKGPFIAVNAPAIPHELIESALFGHEKGAFTGADRRHLGFCEQAHGGTLFLDEICEMDYNVQAKLLRFLEDGRITRLGGTEQRKLDVRVLAATHRDLEEMVENGTFRLDLYYRLNVIPIYVPAVRERKDCLVPLIRHYIDHFSTINNMQKRLTPAALDALAGYSYPGNVRELMNISERLVVMSETEVIDTSDLPSQVVGSAKAGLQEDLDWPETTSLQQALETVECTLLSRARDRYRSQADIAEALGVNQSTIARKLKRYNLA